VGAVVTSLSNTQLGGQWLEKGVKSKGAAYDSVSVGQTQADFNAPVAKLLADGADCLVPVTSPDQGPKIVIAAQQSGKKVKLGATTSEFGATALKTLGAAADGMIITGQEYRPTDTQVPAVQEAVTGLKKYQPDVQLTTKFGVAGWASITALQQVLSSVKGDVTSASVLAAMPTFAPKTGVYADFSYSDKAPVSALPQAKNWGYLVWNVSGGSAVLRSPSFTTPSGL
jgi:ABC-type branched-subunit amino acid transport system substrate-binding protein